MGEEARTMATRVFKLKFWNLCMVQETSFQWYLLWEESPALLDMDLSVEVRAETRLRRVSSTSLVRRVEVDGVVYEASVCLPSSGTDLLWEVLLQEEDGR